MSGSELIREYYQEHYRSAQRSGIQGWGNSLIDVRIERLTKRPAGAKVLEIGASSGEHFAFVDREPKIERYVGLDIAPGITEPELAKKLTEAGLIELVSGDAEAIPFDDDYFDLSVSTCVLAHVANPERVYEELLRVTKPGGRIVIGMPCDPGVINRLVKVLVTYRALRKAGVDNPRLTYAREHVNAVGNLVVLARHVFRTHRFKVHYFPLLIPSWNANLALVMTVDKV